MLVTESIPTSLPLDPRVALAVDGDRRACESILAELLPRVRNLIRYLIRDDADVDDIAQSVLVEILKSLKSYRGEAPLTAWGDRITVRVTLAHARRVRVDRVRRSHAAAELVAVRDDDRPDDYLMRRRAVKLLDTLPAEQRTVVVMHHVLGLSAPEVAEELGIPFETARSRLRLAMRKLRELMEQQ